MAEKKKKWIKKALSNAHGQFRAKAEKAGKSTAEFASEHSGDKGKLGKEARLAKTLMGMHKHSGGHALRKKMYGHKSD